MSRTTFRQEMQEIKDDILLLGSMVEDAVMKSVEALRDNNVERSRFAIVNDQYINRKRFEIEATIMSLTLFVVSALFGGFRGRSADPLV